MLELFPTNYVWNLSSNLALMTGANYGEVDAISRKLVEASKRGDDAGTEAFFNTWCGYADQLVEDAGADFALGRKLSAGEKLGRASVYYATAERMQHRHYAPRKQVYLKSLDCFSRSVELKGDSYELVKIPYRGKHLSGIFVPAKRSAGVSAPCVTLFNGLDSMKEMYYGAGVQRALAERGVSSISVDQPGTGEALRIHGMTAVIEAEEWAGAVIDYLETRNDVDANRIGVTAWSLGGYFAPRAAAREKRFKLCVAWGANYDWGEVQRRRLAREGDRPVPHYWDHVQWVWGQKSLDEFMAFANGVTLEPVISEITVPFLVTHGANDRQIPIEFAYKQYAGAVNSPKRELKIFTEREGGVEHVSVDNHLNVRDYIADWIAETFAELMHK